MAQYTSDRVTLQQDLFKILSEDEYPAMTARELYERLDPERTIDDHLLSHQLVVGALSAMKVLVQTRHLPMLVKELTFTEVPGRFVGQYDRGMVKMPEQKNHWFLHDRREAAGLLRKERRELFPAKSKELQAANA